MTNEALPTATTSTSAATTSAASLLPSSLILVVPNEVLALSRLGDVPTDPERTPSIRPCIKSLVLGKEEGKRDVPSFETVLCTTVRSHSQRLLGSSSSSLSRAACRGRARGC